MFKVEQTASSDEVLYHQVRTGDLRAFDLLYARYEGRLLGFLSRLVGSRHDAEDLLHDAFMNVLRSREVTFDRASFCTWLYRIARNLGLNHLRSGRRKSQLHAQVQPPESGPSAEATVEELQRLQLLQGAVQALPKLQAEIYHLRSAGLSYEEMATELQIPLGTVKSRMNQMMLRLREQLELQLAGSPGAAPARSASEVATSSPLTPYAAAGTASAKEPR